jgi:hypothetical protein
VSVFGEQSQSTGDEKSCVSDGGKLHGCSSSEKVDHPHADVIKIARESIESLTQKALLSDLSV